MSDAAASGQPGPGLRNGSLIFLVVVVAIIAWSWIGGALLGLTSLFASFLFAWYWANVEAMRFDRIPAAVLGGLVGVGLAWLLQALPAALGPGTGLLVALLAILVALFVQTLNWLPLLCNASTMLFLTVMAAPALVKESNFADVALCVVLGALFFAALVRLGTAIASRNAAKAG